MTLSFQVHRKPDVASPSGWPSTESGRHSTATPASSSTTTTTTAATTTLTTIVKNLTPNFDGSIQRRFRWSRRSS